MICLSYLECLVSQHYYKSALSESVYRHQILTTICYSGTYKTSWFPDLPLLYEPGARLLQILYNIYSNILVIHVINIQFQNSAIKIKFIKSMQINTNISFTDLVSYNKNTEKSYSYFQWFKHNLVSGNKKRICSEFILSVKNT